MNKTLEIAAMVLGGVSLFAICFLGFSLQAGVPMQDVPLVGNLFSSTDEAPEEEPVAVERHKSNTEVLHSTLGVLGAWTLPSPYSAEELSALADEMEARNFRLGQRELELERREQDVEEELLVLAERFDGLDRLRTRLEEYEARLTLRAKEIEQGEQAVRERKSERWVQLAQVVSELEPEEASELLSQYEPAEAAEVLGRLDAAEAAALLSGLKATPAGGRWKEYVDAYSSGAGERSD